MRLRTTLIAASVVGVVAVGGLVALEANRPHVAVSYAPAAYGQQVGSTFQCYYLDDPQEALSLIQSGLCPAGSVPTLMPISWHEMYYDYYASPAYYNTYVPVRYRTVWVSQQGSFYSSNRSTILIVQKNASYKGSNGGIVKGSQLGSTTKFGTPPVKVAPTLGGGNRVVPTLSGGNARVTGGNTGLPKPAPSMGGGNARNNPAPKPPSKKP